MNIWLTSNGQQGSNAKNVDNTGAQTRRNYLRIFNKCSHAESVTANTLFHKVKFGIQKAFFICFEMSKTTIYLSTNYDLGCYGIIEKDARLFMHKVRRAMKSSETMPMDGVVHIDEFVMVERRMVSLAAAMKQVRRRWYVL